MMAFPGELRNMVYDLTFASGIRIDLGSAQDKLRMFDAAAASSQPLLGTSRQTRQEYASWTQHQQISVVFQWHIFPSVQSSRSPSEMLADMSRVIRKRHVRARPIYIDLGRLQCREISTEAMHAIYSAWDSLVRTVRKRRYRVKLLFRLEREDGCIFHCELGLTRRTTPQQLQHALTAEIFTAGMSKEERTIVEAAVSPLQVAQRRYVH